MVDLVAALVADLPGLVDQMTTTTEDSLLVGRARETAIIDNAINALATGRGQVLLLSGEPGIGKSSLARYAAAKAVADQRPVYWGFSWEGGGAPSYWPWTQILRPLIVDRKPSPRALAHLGQLLPEQANDGGSDLNPDQARFQLLEAVRSLLDQFSRETPTVLVLEDLHAADTDSLKMLHYISGHVAALPLLIVGTYRDAEARAQPDAEALWRTARQAQVLELARLGKTEIRTFLTEQSDSAPDDERVEQFFSTTEGNPLFLTELVHLLDSDFESDRFRLPANVQQVIRQQMKLLPAATDDLLSKASVIGRTFGPEAIATLAERPLPEIATALEPALDTGFIGIVDGGLYQFSHALHRDVLYQALSESDRSLLHLAYSDHIRDDIGSGSEDRWTELAKHLESAGVEYKRDAIEALQHAASRAVKRLAFDDAAQLLTSAMDAFGSGPKFKPQERCTLVLDCATATMLAGNIAAGQALCKDAFAIARALEDTTLMATAALTWGSTFVVAKVDKNLIAALQECLEQLPEQDVPIRAKVLARLAAALQPAPNPAEPMELAREAIRLARTVNDDEVLYHVLRSAISALMDFAPIAERIPLNHEFGALAQKFGDVPGRFRSSLRIMIDASEAGDRTTMINAIDACDQLARRIDLPHYLWRAASARAMQATIEGNFDRATRLIDEAEFQARKIDEVEARITLPIQRFTILTEWQSADEKSLELIKTQLHECFESGMEEAEFFVAPFVLSYTSANDPDVAQQLVSDAQMIERSFASGDRFLLGRVAELGITAGDTKLAERAIDALAPHENDCASLGLMGSTWAGPVAYYLGTVSAALGRTQAAVAYLETALKISERMKSLPHVARVHLALADAEAELGNREKAESHAEAGRRICERLALREHRGVPPEVTTISQDLAIDQQGDVWNVSFKGKLSVVRDSKGMHMLARLIQTPGQEVHALDLSGSSIAAAGDSGPSLDPEARAQYKARIKDLQDGLEEAHDLGDIGKVDTIQSELDILTRELSRAFGIGGKERRSGSAAERARVNVRRRLKDAISRIAEQNSEAGIYLENTVKTGTYCKFVPM